MKTVGSEGPPTPEREPIKTVYLVYRDNQLFTALRKQLVQNFEALNYRVVNQVFPAGTDEKDISAWAAQHQDDLAQSEIVTDDTFFNSLHNPKLAGKITLSSRDAFENNLDRLTDKATKRVLLGNEVFDEEGLDLKEDLETTRQAMIALIRRILSNPANTPKRVFISNDNLLSHRPFRGDSTSEPAEFSAEWLKQLRSVTEQLQSWLTEAGISADSIVIDDPPSNEDHESNWLIVDRHALSTLNRVKQIKKLLMPLQSFYESAMEEGLLTVKSEELEQALKQEIEERFSSKDNPKSNSQ